MCRCVIRYVYTKTGSNVSYEWDEAKNRRNQRKHKGVSFELAALVFEDETGETMACDRFACSWLRSRLGRIALVKKSSVSSRPAGLKSMKALREASASLAAGDDSGINFDDIPQLTDEQLASMVRLRDIARKVPVSVRLDPRVLDWLKSKGEGHLTRINDILMNLMEAEHRSKNQ